MANLLGVPWAAEEAEVEAVDVSTVVARTIGRGIVHSRETVDPAAAVEVASEV